MLECAKLTFVVMDVATVKQQISTTEIFYTRMFIAFWLNVVVPVSLHCESPISRCSG